MSAVAKARLSEIVERLAQLQTTFAQNVLADEASWCLWLNREEDLQGLPDSLRVAAPAAWDRYEALVREGARHPWKALMHALLGGAGVADPTDDRGLDEIREAVGRRVRFKVALTSEIESALTDAFGEPLAASA